MNAAEVFEQIQKEALKHENDPKFVRVIKKDEGIRQGDLYIVKVGNVALGEEIPGTKLVPGITKGAEHHAVGAKLFQRSTKKVVINKRTVPAELVGPVIVADGRFDIQHPEHADFSLPAGTYQVIYQRDFEQEEIRRVAD